MALWHSLAKRYHRPIRSIVMGVLSAFVFAPAAVDAHDSFVLRPAACHASEMWSRCVRRLEPEVLARVGGHVVRQGRTLSVRLENGRVTKRIDSPGEYFDTYNEATDKPNRKFNAIGFLKRPRYLVVEVHYYEGAEVVTVVPCRDMTAAVAIWRTSADGVRRVFQHEPSQDWPTVTAEWRSSDTIEMRQWDKTTGAPAGVFAELNLRGGRWSLTRLRE